MENTERVLNVLPHYLVLLILVFVLLAAVRELLGDLGFAVELLLVLAVTIAYPPVVRRMGVAPESWAKQ
ncbi:hypothetical protein [Natronomonas salsuginis]|uniref:Uncharacterized protein n=1 Tax=Natronomonas salsuginis TaxID=2217661 RepID=A0A4U5JFM2_9EURY|nr:hypothetical protein [Natronomonas salsuginis]TKR24839.1 hypothetical protein DM868_12935 [Natronomonas salsuginis]